MEHLILSDIPTPWREPVFERVHQALGERVDVVYFRGNEQRRLWRFPMGRHPKTILPGVSFTLGETERFLNPGLPWFLLRRRPRIALVFTSMKDPSGWLALSCLRLLGTRVALLDDTWLGRDRGISAPQRWARSLTYSFFGDAFVGASRRTLEMFRHYNGRISDEQCFLSHLVADNDYFAAQLPEQSCTRSFDLAFSGRIVAVKNPTFFAEVCAGVKARMGTCSALIIGDGDEATKRRMRAIFDRHGVSYEFTGFVPHAALPLEYARARVLLLPTASDCWGVVINEAMLAGMPVVTTEWTAASGELVLDRQNGYVLPLALDPWVAAAVHLLSDEALWQRFSACARATVAGFNYERAANGILDAFAYLRSRG